MPRARLYETDADRQQAYRDRVEARRIEAARIERERQAVLAEQQRRLRRQADDMMVAALREVLTAGGHFGFFQDEQEYSSDVKQVRAILRGYLGKFERGLFS